MFPGAAPDHTVRLTVIPYAAGRSSKNHVMDIMMVRRRIWSFDIMPGSKRGLVAPQNTILESIVNLVGRNNWQGGWCQSAHMNESISAVSAINYVLTIVLSPIGFSGTTNLTASIFWWVLRGVWAGSRFFREQFPFFFLGCVVINDATLRYFSLFVRFEIRRTLVSSNWFNNIGQNVTVLSLSPF